MTLDNLERPKRTLSEIVAQIDAYWCSTTSHVTEFVAGDILSQQDGRTGRERGEN